MVFNRHRLLMNVFSLSAATAWALGVAPAWTATIAVTTQAQFDAAIAMATQPGHADTIDASTAGTIDAGPSLTLPAAATSVNLEFGNLDIGTNMSDATATFNAGTTVSFGQANNPGEFDMGFGHTGTLNINGASLIFDITNAGTQFNVGLDGGNGIVNMTSGAVRINDSSAVPGKYGSISIGWPFGVTAANATFNQSGGMVSVSAGALNVGIANGVGTYNMTGAAVLQDLGGTVYIGASTDGVGDLNVSGNATLDLESILAGAGGQLYVGDNRGMGTITQNGANSTVILNVINIAQFGSNASEAPGGGGTGAYNLEAGTLEIGGSGAAFGMDTGGTGIFNQSGGALTANAPIVIGRSGSGAYNLSGGAATLNAGLTIATLAGSVGTVNQTGGVLTIAGGRLIVGSAGAATYNLDGGLLQVGGSNGIIGTGTLNVGGGALQVIGSGLTTNIAMSLTAGSDSTVDTNGLGATFGGVLSGDGALTKVGAGTLVLAGVNAYTGGTTIIGGLVLASNSNSVGTGAVALAGGGFQTGASGLVYGNDFTLGAAANNIDTQAFSLNLSGAVSGAVGVTKTGAGTLTLSGVNVYTGPTTVNAGILDVNGSLASAVSVNSGGLLKGDGSVRALHLASGGGVAPGNSIGTLSVNGNASFAAGSSYQVEVNAAGQSDRIAATGAATLVGGTVQVLGAPRVYTGPTKYTILTAAAITGTFSKATSDFAFLMPSLSYDANDVFLTLSRNPTYFVAAARTPNQRAAAAALDLSPSSSALVQAVLPLAAPEAALAFDLLSGEIHASIQTELFDGSRYMRQAILGRMRQASFADVAGPLAALSAGGPSLAYPDPQPASPGGASVASASAAGARVTGWGQVVGAWGRIASDGNAAALDRDLDGVFTGIDGHFSDNWRAGMASGYTHSRLSSDARASAADIDTVHVAAYALGQYGPWSLRSGADIGWNDITSNRSVNFPGIANHVSAHYSAAVGQIFGEVGHGVTLGHVAAEPFAGIAWVHSNTSRFSETGGVAALTSSAASGNVGYSALGGRIAVKYSLANGITLTPRVSVAWQRAFGDVAPVASLGYRNTGVGFGVYGAPLAPNAAVLETSFDLAITRLATIGISYTGVLANSARDQSLKGNLTWKF